MDNSADILLYWLSLHGNISFTESRITKICRDLDDSRGRKGARQAFDLLLVRGHVEVMAVGVYQVAPPTIRWRKTDAGGEGVFYGVRTPELKNTILRLVSGGVVNEERQTPGYPEQWAFTASEEEARRIAMQLAISFTATDVRAFFDRMPTLSVYAATLVPDEECGPQWGDAEKLVFTAGERIHAAWNSVHSGIADTGIYRKRDPLGWYRFFLVGKMGSRLGVARLHDFEMGRVAAWAEIPSLMRPGMQVGMIDATSLVIPRPGKGFCWQRPPLVLDRLVTLCSDQGFVPGEDGWLSRGITMADGERVLRILGLGSV